MRKERMGAAREVADSLFAAENDVDAALASAAGLISRMVGARAEANLPVVIGQEALEAMGAAVASLIQTRRQVIDAHEGLATIQTQIGLGTVAWGDQFPKPPPTAELNEPRMRVVGSDS